MLGGPLILTELKAAFIRTHKLDDEYPITLDLGNRFSP